MQGAHVYRGSNVGRGARLQSKVGHVIPISRLEALLGGKREPIKDGLANPRQSKKRDVKGNFRMEQHEG
jgi:hypothetical protein